MKFTDYEIGGFKLKVSEDGKTILDVEANCEVKLYVSKSNYIGARIGDMILPVHRIVAAAWDCPGNGRMVNHLDGDKHNNHRNNLVWCCPSDNLVHAYKIGLRNDNTIVEIKDLSTGVITSHYSLQDAARHMGCNGNSIYMYLKDINKVRRGKYVVKKIDQDWPPLTEKDIYEYKKPTSTHKRVVRKPSRITTTNLVTGEFKVWDSIHEFADSLKVKSATIAKSIYVNGGKTSNGGRWRDYYIRYLNKSLANHEESTKLKKKLPK